MFLIGCRRTGDSIRMGSDIFNILWLRRFFALKTIIWPVFRSMVSQRHLLVASCAFAVNMNKGMCDLRNESRYKRIKIKVSTNPPTAKNTPFRNMSVFGINIQNAERTKNSRPAPKKIFRKNSG